ncbi:MAG: AMP-binding protein [Alphaproteobacteria bacterium]|nr:AMP-binding protein [Alphaproteobacteria bacterium]
MTPTLAAAFDRVPPDRVALIERGTPLRFGGIADRARGLAGGLSALGLCRGDRVALWLGNRREWLETLLACARLGVTVVAVNTRLGTVEVGDLLRRCEARALVLAPEAGMRRPAEELAALEPAARATLETVIVVGDGAVHPGLAPRVVAFDALAAGAPLGSIDAQPDDGLVVFTTSGTTSRPKLVLHGQCGVVRHARDVAAAFGLDAGDTVVLQALPLAGVFGFSQALATLLAGRALVMMESFDADSAASLMRAHAVTNLVGTNEMLDRMLDARTETRPFPVLRFFGHANFNPALVELPAKAEARGVRLRGLFGMSETLALFAIQPEGAILERRALAGGLPVSADARARIADPESGALAASGKAGELQVRGPSLFIGYLGDEAATRRAFTPDGWFRTGDIGIGLDDGGFTLLGRMGDTLRLGGYLVNPLEIEQVVAEDPSVAACQAVERNRRDGTRVIAFVVLAPGAALDEPALLARCRAKLAGYKVPARIVALDRFPTTDGPNGTKVRRAELRAMAAALR